MLPNIVVMKPYSITREVYAVIEKEAKNGGNSGRVFTPKAWAGKKVAVLLLEPLEDDEKQ